MHSYMCVGMLMPSNAWGGQRAASWSQFSPPIMWVPRSKQAIRPGGQGLYLLSHITVLLRRSVSSLNSIFIFCGNFLVSFRCLFSLGIHSGICPFLWTYLSSFLWTFCPGFHPSHSHWVMYSGIGSSSRRHIVMVFVSFMVLLWGLHIKSQIVVGFFFLII